MTPEETTEDLPPSNETVLVVDDDPDFLRVMGLILADQGYRIVTAVDGRDALEVANATDKEIHLILLDTVMPTMTGLEAFPLLVDALPGAKVLFHSGNAPDAQMTELIESGQAGYLKKGIPLDDLCNSIRSALDGE